MKLEVTPSICNLFGECVTQAPELFRINEDGELEYETDVPPELEERALAAARSCPSGAIQLRPE